MTRVAGMDTEEGQEVIGLPDYMSVLRARDDFAKDAIFHEAIISYKEKKSTVISFSEQRDYTGLPVSKTIDCRYFNAIIPARAHTLLAQR